MLLWLWFVPLNWIKRWWVGCGWSWTVCRDVIDVTRIQGRKAVTWAHDGWFKQIGCEIRHSTVGTMPRDVIQCHIYWSRHMHAIGVKPLFTVVTSYSSLFPCDCFTVYGMDIWEFLGLDFVQCLMHWGSVSLQCNEEHASYLVWCLDMSSYQDIRVSLRDALRDASLYLSAKINWHWFIAKIQKFLFSHKNSFF